MLLNEWLLFFLLTSCLTLAPCRRVLFNWLPGMGYQNSSLISFYLLISLYFPHLHLPQTYSVKSYFHFKLIIYFSLGVLSNSISIQKQKDGSFLRLLSMRGFFEWKNKRKEPLGPKHRFCFLHPWIWPCIMAVSTSSSSPVQCCSFSPFWISFSTIFWS